MKDKLNKPKLNSNEIEVLIILGMIDLPVLKGSYSPEGSGAHLREVLASLILVMKFMRWYCLFILSQGNQSARDIVKKCYLPPQSFFLIGGAEYHSDKYKCPLMRLLDW